MLTIKNNTNVHTDPFWGGKGAVIAALFGASIIAVPNTYQYASAKPCFETIQDDQELTRMGMAFSELSLAEDWDNEDDAHWDNLPAI